MPIDPVKHGVRETGADVDLAADCPARVPKVLSSDRTELSSLQIGTRAAAHLRPFIKSVGPNYGVARASSSRVVRAESLWRDRPRCPSHAIATGDSLLKGWPAERRAPGCLAFWRTRTPDAAARTPLPAAQRSRVPRDPSSEVTRGAEPWGWPCPRPERCRGDHSGDTASRPRDPRGRRSLAQPAAADPRRRGSLASWQPAAPAGGPDRQNARPRARRTPPPRGHPGSGAIDPAGSSANSTRMSA